MYVTDVCFCDIKEIGQLVRQSACQSHRKFIELWIGGLIYVFDMMLASRSNKPARRGYMVHAK